MEVKESFLTILKGYFEKLEENDVLMKEGKNPYIPIEWMFSETLDRTIFQEAIANIMKKKNPAYKKRAEFLKRDPNQISHFRISIFEGQIKLQAIGQDDWTKINIVENKDEKEEQNGVKYIPNITIEELEKEILEVLNGKNLEKILAKVYANESQKESITSNLIKADYPSDKINLLGIKESLKEISHNLIEYYQYLIDHKKSNEVYSTTIKQRSDEKDIKKSRGGTATPRLNPIIPFIERNKILDSMNPKNTVNVNEVDEDGNIIHNSYIAYIYDEALPTQDNKNGIIFICEPLEGNRRTRIIYLTKEEYENFKTTEDKPKAISIVEKYIEMSEEEFRREEGTQIINHLELEQYKEKIEFFLNGEISENKSIKKNATYYYDKIEELYKRNLSLVKRKPRKNIDPDSIKNLTKVIPFSKIDKQAIEETKIKDGTRQNI